MIVAVDSMALAPSPSTYPFEVTVSHGRLLLDTPASTARRALRRGVTLHDLVVERMGFTADTGPRSGRTRDPDVRERRSEPRTAPSIYTATRIIVGWRAGPRPYYVDADGGERIVEGRRETGARAPAADDARSRPSDRSDGVTAEREERDGQGDDEASSEDDDDDTSLRLPALGAAAAVGLVAVVGGTVGLYGRGDTPIGLAANWERVVLFGGVDVVQGTPEVGLTYNVRYRSDRNSPTR